MIVPATKLFTYSDAAGKNIIIIWPHRTQGRPWLENLAIPGGSGGRERKRVGRVNGLGIHSHGSTAVIWGFQDTTILQLTKKADAKINSLPKATAAFTLLSERVKENWPGPSLCSGNFSFLPSYRDTEALCPSQWRPKNSMVHHNLWMPTQGN